MAENQAKKEKSDWELFTNNGKFNSKIPPSQRLIRKKSKFHKSSQTLYLLSFVHR